MKKIISILLTLILAFSLAACGSSTDQTADQSQEETNQPETQDQESQEPETEDPGTAVPDSEEPQDTDAGDSAEADVPAEEEGGQILVAYFSWSGNTRQLAEMIQSETQGDLFAIEPATPYTEDYDTLLDVAQQEQRDNARPELAAQVDNWENYDTIFVGYPNWWGDAPMIILSFLEEYDCTGKTIIPFCTSGGGGFGSSVSSIEGSVAGATVEEGLHVSGSRVDGAASDVAAWIEELNLAQ